VPTLVTDGPAASVFQLPSGFRQIAPRIAEDRPRRVQEQTGDGEGDDQVGPRAAEPRDQPGGGDYGKVADGVVARE